MVVNHKNTIYALSPKCPHLGLPMKTGEISDDGPCITCKFHGTALMLIAHDFCYFSQFFTGSKFDLKTGKAVKWSESVLGLPGTQFLGNIVGNVSHHRNLAPHRIEISQTPALPLRHTSAQLPLPPPCQETIAERPTELHPPHNSRAQRPTRRLLRPALTPEERARARRRSTDAPTPPAPPPPPRRSAAPRTRRPRSSPSRSTPTAPSSSTRPAPARPARPSLESPLLRDHISPPAAALGVRPALETCALLPPAGSGCGWARCVVVAAIGPEARLRPGPARKTPVAGYCDRIRVGLSRSESARRTSRPCAARMGRPPGPHGRTRLVAHPSPDPTRMGAH